MLERLKVKYVFEEGVHPDKDIDRIIREIRDHYFDYWLNEVFIEEYGEDIWREDPDSVIDTFFETEEEQLNQRLTDLQKKILFHSQILEKFKDVLAEVEIDA